MSNALAQAPIVIKFSHVVAKDTPKGKAAEKFRELAEAATKGRVKVEVYPNSTLYKDKEELEALQLGAVQMLAPSLAKFGPLGVKEFELFDLPYIFPDKAALDRVTDGPIGRDLLKKLESKGLLGLAYWDNGFKVMSANKPLRTPADLQGLRMRIQPSKVLDEQMRAVGAVPQVLAFSDVLSALKGGLVDGQENTASNFYTQSMYTAQKYLTVTDHGYLGYAVIANRKFWEALPGDLRSLLEVALLDATDHANSIAAQRNAEDLQAIKATGKTQVLTLNPAEKLAFKKAFLPVHRAMADRIGADLIKQVYAATQFDPKAWG